MAKVWIKAKTIVHVQEGGKLKTLYPGDWGQMGKQQAREKLARDEIEILRPNVLQAVQDLTDCAILIKGEITEMQKGLLAAKFPGVPIQPCGSGYPGYGRFLLWDVAANLKQELILTGFKLLQKWQLAVPLFDYRILAERVGTPQERQETEAVIHDLRVPVYDSRVMFVRQCNETKQLFAEWGESHLSFLQALYRSRPTVNALPPTWIYRDA